MSELDDHDLLARYAWENSEAAFAALADRHVNLVYSVALRSIGNPHAAEEITQAVLIILANKVSGNRSGAGGPVCSGGPHLFDEPGRRHH